MLNANNQVYSEENNPVLSPELRNFHARREMEGGVLSKFATTKSSSPTIRLLQVMSIIGTAGPITLTELTAKLKISRTAVWRALSALQRAGYVRMRLGDNAFEYTSFVKFMFDSSHAADASAEHYSNMLTSIAKVGPYYADYGHFTAYGQFEIIETTRKNAYNKSLSLVDDNIAIAALLKMSPEEQCKHIDAYMQNATNDQLQYIKSGEYKKQINNYITEGVVWEHDNISISIPVTLSENSIGGAITIGLKVITKNNIENLERFSDNFKIL